MAQEMDTAALQAFLASSFPQVAEDFRVEHLTPEGIVVRMVVADRHLRPGGTVSGPSLFALADVAVYLALLSRIGPVALAVTTNASIDFLRKPQAGRDLIAEARLLKQGRVLVVGDVLIRSEGGADPVARASMTYSIPPR
ncbi:MAG TPA: PaaI family thioesterase [Paracoccaceae bacterium]|nr:PaaI family thioesterase [Paracoccaceae bacterium]